MICGQQSCADESDNILYDKDIVIIPSTPFKQFFPTADSD